jgi:hypothetical protein
MKIDIKILLPDTATVRGVGLVGVYKIELDSGQFYIGSSVHLKKRAVRWRGFFKRCVLNNRNDGRFIIDNTANCSSGVFSVIEYVEDTSFLQEREMFFIKQSINNPKCLNRFSLVEKPITSYLPDGSVVKKYKSVSWAHKSDKFSSTRIIVAARDGNVMYRGMYWKYDNSEHFEYKPYENRWAAWNAINKPPKEKKVKVLKYSTDGVFISGHISTADAARSVGVNSKGVYSVLKGDRRTAGGFVFKYA